MLNASGLAHAQRPRGRVKSNGSTKFVKKEDLPTVRKQIKNHERTKLQTDRWIELAIELSIPRLPLGAAAQ